MSQVPRLHSYHTPPRPRRKNCIRNCWCWGARCCSGQCHSGPCFLLFSARGTDPWGRATPKEPRAATATKIICFLTHLFPDKREKCIKIRTYLSQFSPVAIKSVAFGARECENVKAFLWPAVLVIIRDEHILRASVIAMKFFGDKRCNWIRKESDSLTALTIANCVDSSTQVWITTQFHLMPHIVPLWFFVKFVECNIF